MLFLSRSVIASSPVVRVEIGNSFLKIFVIRHRELSRGLIFLSFRFHVSFLCLATAILSLVVCFIILLNFIKFSLPNLLLLLGLLILLLNVFANIVLLWAWGCFPVRCYRAHIDCSVDDYWQL